MQKGFQQSAKAAGYQQLPTLDEVLRRQSRPPVCLYNYYIVLRDRLNLSILLDFWLDVQQARILHKRYMKYNKLKNGSNSSSSTNASLQPSPTVNSPHQLIAHYLLSRPFIASTHAKPSLAEMTEIIEHIYLRYIVPHAEKELIYLPETIRDDIVRRFDNGGGTSNPDPAVFDEAQAYVHRLLEATFPHFLRYKVLMNLTLQQQLGRIACGLSVLLIGFSVEFSLIFLNIRPWQYRVWGLLPIFVGVFCTISGLTGVDPLWVLLFNVGETTTFKFNRIQHPGVKRVLAVRSLNILAFIVFVTAILLLIFCAVPGKRL